VLLAGKSIVGARVSSIFTVKVRDPELPALSRAEQVTVVVPMANVPPESGEHETPMLPSTLSDAEAV
jgi:hypothetical protein